MKLSILIPVYNEAQSLGELCGRLVVAAESVTSSFEIVFSNDGSTDESGETLDALAATDPRIKVVHLRRNFGQTAAIMAALDHSTGDVIVMLDADLQNEPADIPRLIQKLDEGYDVVSGWRVNRKDATLSRNFPSRVANWLISKLSGVKIHDYGCMLKSYRRWTLENVRLYGEMHRYIPIYASWEGARVTELPVSHNPRRFGNSKYGLGRIPRVMLDLLVILFFDRARDRPMQFFGVAGLISLGLACLGGLTAIYLRAFEGIKFTQTPLPLLVVMFTICALLCLFLGVLAEILIRTYFESRDRRSYTVRAIVNGGDRR